MLRNWQAFQDLAKRFAGGDVCLRVAGLAGSARALAVAELLQIHPRPVLVIVASLADAHRFAQDLKFFGAPAFEFPEREPQLWKGGHHREAEAERAMIVSCCRWWRCRRAPTPAPHACSSICPPARR